MAALSRHVIDAPGNGYPAQVSPQRSRRSWLRAYVIAFDVALVGVVVAFAVLAVTGPPDLRGVFISMAILWSVLASGALALTVAVKRRRSRRETGDAGRRRS